MDIAMGLFSSPEHPWSEKIKGCSCTSCVLTSGGCLKSLCTWMIWLTLSHPQKAGLPCIGTCADKPVVQKSLWVHNHPFAELHLLTQPCWACQAVGWGQMFLCVCRHGAGLSLSSRDNPKLRVFHQKGNLLTAYFVWWKNTQHSWLDCIY